MQYSPLEKILAPLTDKLELQAWLKVNLGFTLPDQKITEFADSTPLDFVWDTYSAIMEGRSLNILAVSGRDSSKTVSLSIIDLLAITHDQRSAIHMGMTKAQATRARKYFDDYLAKMPAIKALVTKQNESHVEIKFNPDEESVILELLPLSPKAVQGPHYSLVSYDELASSLDPTNLKAYKDSSGIIGSSRKGKPAVVPKISSRQAGFSLVEDEIKRAIKNNVKIVKWTTIDTMKRCPDERSGTERLPMWIDIKKGVKFTEAEFNQLPDGDKDGFKYAPDTMKGCYTCPLALYCQGKARNQRSDSALLRSIDDVIQKVNNAGSHDWVLSQLMSLQPSKEGLVYFEFSRDIHIPGWNAMWERLTGEKPPLEITRELFIRECHKRKLEFYAGVDWGWSSPSTCVVIAMDKRDNIFVLEAFGKTYCNDPDWVNQVSNFLKSKYPTLDMLLPDPENKSGIDLFRKANMPVTEVDKGPGSVKNGINCLKGKLKVPGTNNATKLMLAPDLQQMAQEIPGLRDVPSIIDEFELYKKATGPDGKIKDDENPEKGNDHYLDALRYVLYWRFGKATGQAVFANGKEEMMVNPFPQSEEMAQMSGIPFVDNRHEFDQMGKQAKPKQQDDDDDDPDPSKGGGSGLQWAWT